MVNIDKQNLVKNILKTLEDFKKLGIKIVCQDGKYIIDASNFSVEIIIDLENWISLVFYLHDGSNKNVLNYYFDTDLYNLKELKNEFFVIEILSQMELFLKNLINKQIYICNSNRKYSMYFSNASGITYIRKGFVFTSVKYLENINKMKDYEKFQPISLT